MILSTLLSQQRLILTSLLLLNHLLIKNKLSSTDIIFQTIVTNFFQGIGFPRGALINIKNSLPYNTRNYIKTYKYSELESTFAQICNHKKTNIFTRWIYKHPHMNINESNNYYLNELLDKLSIENEAIFLLSDFNFNFVKYNIHLPTNEFLDSLSPRYFLLDILQSSREKQNSKILKDNTVFNMLVLNIIYGN